VGIELKLAVDFLNNVLWNEEVGGYQEALTRPYFWWSDNFLAWIVMRKYHPKRAAIVYENLQKPNYFLPHVKMYEFWGILLGDTEAFKSCLEIAPDYPRWFDLMAAQYLYHNFKGERELADQLFDAMMLQFDGKFVYDRATYDYGFSAFKNAFMAICATYHRRYDVAEQALNSIRENFQVFPGIRDHFNGLEVGGIKTEIWPEEWGPAPYEFALANVETTCLSIIAQDTYNNARMNDFIKVLIGGLIGTGLAAIPIIKGG